MSKDFDRIASAIRYITAHRLDQPDLDAVAAHVGLSPYHFQRLFTRWAGVSPKRFLGFLTVQHARALLAQDASVLDTALDVGLSGPSRLHDLFVSFEAMTPGEAKNGGANLTISYSVLGTPFGAAVAMSTPKGICGLEFIEAGEDPRARAQQRWPGAHLVKGFEPDLAERLFAPAPQQLHSPAPQRHQFSDPSLASADEHRARTPHHLQTHRRTGVQRQGRARGRRRHRGQSRRGFDPVPPGHQGKRRGRRLPLGL